MKISIVTPSYNQGAFLEKTIKSVLDQNYPDLEYIVIDGGSTDNSIEIINKYADKLSYYISELDSGQSNAINKGFIRATGDILAWINSDDQYYPGVLQKIAMEFENNPSVDLIYGYHNDINEKEEVVRKGFHIPFSRHTFKIGFGICQPTSFWRRRIWDKCGPLDVQLHYCMDYDFYAKALKCGFIFKSIRLLVCKFRYHKSNKGTIARHGFKSEGNYVMSKHFPAYHSNYIIHLMSSVEIAIIVAIRRIIRSFC
jgi:glycosyltransferase involved in cell wall biosynthesis